jgi:hypothetical protein
MTLVRDSRGAVSVEYLAAFLPMMFFFASVWQLMDLYAAQLIVQRAASAAGRAASVVLPDDPYYYDGTPIGAMEGQRRAQIELAASLVLDASLRMLAEPEVEVEGAADHGPLTARITAGFQCIPGWSVFVCGIDARRTLRASARYPYHSATYSYP